MDPHNLRNFIIESVTAFSDVNIEKLPADLKKKLNHFNLARAAMYSPLLLIIYFRLITLCIFVPLCYWGYLRYKKLYPVLDMDLEPYRHTKQQN